MSIHDEIKGHVERGNLVEIARRDLRAMDDLEYRRWLFVSSAVNQEIAGRFNEPAFRRLSAQFQTFIMGQTIPIALVPNHKRADWARLEPANHEVWETRVRHTRPELRVLGRFADVDTFVALNLYEGWELWGWWKWNAAKAHCLSDWLALFPSSSPVIGRTVSDYISANFTLI